MRQSIQPPKVMFPLFPYLFLDPRFRVSQHLPGICYPGCYHGNEFHVILRDNPTAISNLHCTKHDSSDPATKNDFSRDYEDHLNIDTNFKIPVVCDFDLRKKSFS